MCTATMLPRSEIHRPTEGECLPTTPTQGCNEAKSPENSGRAEPHIFKGALPEFHQSGPPHAVPASWNWTETKTKYRGATGLEEPLGLRSHNSLNYVVNYLPLSLNLEVWVVAFLDLLKSKEIERKRRMRKD